MSDTATEPRHLGQTHEHRALCTAAGWMLACSSFGCSAGGLEEGGNGPATSLAAKTEFSESDVLHMLSRTRFGASADDMATAMTVGVQAFVDAMLTVPPIDSTTWEQAARAELQNMSDPPGLEGMFPSSTQVTRWWLHNILHNENPFQEQVAMFWHDHFATDVRVLNSDRRHWMIEHANLFRSQGLGNFRSLLLAVSRDPAMLTGLDGIVSTKTDPNENFAREFFELFTVGVDNGYTETDITEAARAFTGYRRRFDAGTGLSYVEFDEDRKDVGFKVLFTDEILQTNAPEVDDFDLVVDATLRRLDVAGFLASKLLRWFCMEAPPQTLVDALAVELRRNDYEMAPTFRTLLLSEAFYSDAAQNSLVSSPLDFAVGFIRSTGLEIEVDDLERELRDLQQVPAQPPSVDGWPSGDDWLSAQSMVDRANLVRRCIVERSYQSGAGIEVAMPDGVTDPAAVVDHFARLLGIAPSVDERATCITYLDTEVNRNTGALSEDPFDATSATHVDERVRGLLYILAQHPDAMIR